MANLVICILLAGLFAFSFAGGSAEVGSAENGAYYHGDRSESRVSLMINVYQGEEYVEKMLEVFKTYGVKTTFFVGGVWCEKQPALLRQISIEGHEVGNHGFYHKDSDKITEARLIAEISNTNTVIKASIGAEPSLFAPPSGAVNSAVVNVAKTLGMATVMWSKDTIDWRDSDVAKVRSRATEGVAGGDLILMHPTAHTLEALPYVLEYYKNQGLSVVSVSECLNLDSL